MDDSEPDHGDAGWLPKATRPLRTAHKELLHLLAHRMVEDFIAANYRRTNIDEIDGH